MAVGVIIDGNRIAGEIRKKIGERVAALKKDGSVVPGLAVILVGDDPASRVYVGRKEKACAEAGFFSRTHRLSIDTPQDELLGLIGELNGDRAVHGILVQLPLPSHIDSQAVIEAIDPAKDVDGFHPVNMGRLLTGASAFVPCTPQGVIALLDGTGIEIAGKEAVIVGRSNIVGKPLAFLLLARHATVTLCHTRTRDLPSVTRRADILVAAAGRSEMIDASMVKEGAVVIDVGINRRADGTLVGDVAFAEVAAKASFITPVPGGVGPMTIAMLLKNTLEAALRAYPSG